MKKVGIQTAEQAHQELRIYRARMYRALLNALMGGEQVHALAYEHILRGMGAADEVIRAKEVIARLEKDKVFGE